MKKIFILIIPCCLAVAAIGCTRNIVLRDAWLERWLKNPVCLPPCWENTTPGKTSLPDARATLPQIPGTRVTTAVESETDFELGENASGAFFSDANGIVQMIWIYFGANPPLQVGDVVSKYGYPSEVSFSFYTPDEPNFNLLYPKFGMVISTYPYNHNPSHFPNDPQFDIQPAEQIIRIQLYAPELQYYLHQVLPENGDPYKISNWIGYGHYSYSK